MKFNFLLLLKCLILVAFSLSTVTTTANASNDRRICIQEEALKLAEQSIVDVLVDHPDYEHDEFPFKAVVVSQNRLIVVGMFTVRDLYLGKNKNLPLDCITPKAFDKENNISKENPYCNILAPHCIYNVAVCSLKSGNNWNLPAANMPSSPLPPMLEGEIVFAVDFINARVPNPCMRKLEVSHAVDFSSSAPNDRKFLHVQDPIPGGLAGAYHDTGGPLFVKRGNQIVVSGLIMGAAFSRPLHMHIHEWSEKSPLRNFLDCALKPGPLPKNCL